MMIEQKKRGPKPKSPDQVSVAQVAIRLTGLELEKLDALRTAASPANPLTRSDAIRRMIGKTEKL